MFMWCFGPPERHLQGVSSKILGRAEAEPWAYDYTRLLLTREAGMEVWEGGHGGFTWRSKTR